MLEVLKKSVKSIISLLVILSLILMTTLFANASDLALDGAQSKLSVTTRYSVLVLDTSGSMAGVPIAKAKEAAVNFCKQVMVAEGENYVAIVSLNSSATTICNFTNDLSTLTSKINSISANGNTNHEAALSVAGQLLENVNLPESIKNIVLMSDGLPVNGKASYNGPYTSSDYSGYYYANAAYEKAQELKTQYYIYSLGFFTV